MKKDWVLTPESFEALLAWLDPQRERAGEKYEEIRRRLIKIFTSRGCNEPEDLADETINRVIKKLREIEETFTGDPARYFFGVAQKIHLEYLRRKPIPPTLPIKECEPSELEYRCLERCMEHLTPDNRNLVLQYYEGERQDKIVCRKRLAEQLGIAVNALRIRTHRIRISLEECVQKCLQEATA